MRKTDEYRRTAIPKTFQNFSKSFQAFYIYCMLLSQVGIFQENALAISAPGHGGGGLSTFWWYSLIHLL